VSEDIGTIRAEYGAEQSGILSAFKDRVAEIAERGSDDIPNKEYLQYGQLERIMLDAKASEVEAETIEYRAQLREAFKRYQERLTERTNVVKSELFGVTAAELGALAQASLADTDGLASMMGVAEQAGNKDLARVAFTVATRRDEPAAAEIASRYLTLVPEHRGFYAEWNAMPSEEQLSRQRDNIDRLISAPAREQLIPRPKARSYQ
jgi:hypothetical protein